MNLISIRDRYLIQDLCDGKINKSEFMTKTDFKVNFIQLNLLLDETELKVNEYGDNGYFAAIFWDLPNILSTEEKINLFKKYLLKNWHREHEEIGSSFQAFFFNAVENIPILSQAINNIPEYLKENDFKYSYIRKLIYAIGAQPEPYNIEALEKIANETEDEQIKDLALHQIKKRKEFGRWESAENTE